METFIVAIVYEKNTLNLQFDERKLWNVASERTLFSLKESKCVAIIYTQIFLEIVLGDQTR